MLVKSAPNPASVTTTSASFKGACGFVIDGYFYGTQGLLASSKANYETFNALRGTIPTPTVGYEPWLPEEHVLCCHIQQQPAPKHSV